MAITFEEKNNTVRDAAIVAGMAALLLAAGFFVWKSIQETPTADLSATASKIKINKEILDDARFSALELFPEIPAVATATTTARENPFAKEIGPEAAAPAAPAAASGRNENGTPAE